MTQMTDAAEELDLRDYLAPVWRFKWIILALALLIALAAYVHYSRKPDIYQSSTDIYLGTSGIEGLVTGTEQPGSERTLANQARVLRSRAVAERVARKIGFRGDPDALLGSLQVIADPNADFVTLVTVWSNPVSAANLANAFAQAFLDQRLATRRANADEALQAARAAMADLKESPGKESDERRELAARISQLEILRSLPTGEGEQLNRARPAAAPSSPRPKRNAIFAFVLALAFGILVAYAIDRVDRRIRDVDEVTPIYDAPVLGTIPRAAEKLSPGQAPVIPSSLRESFRTLRTSLEVAGAVRGTLLVASGLPGEGKSMVVRNLAMAYLESAKEVAIVEADLRRPTAASWLCTPPEPGLTHVLRGEATLDEALHEVPCEIPGTWEWRTHPGRNGSSPAGHSENGNAFSVMPGLLPGDLFLLPGGSRAADPPTLLQSHEFRLLLVELAERFDIVLIDSPALLSVSDAVPLLPEVPGTLIVSRLGASTEESARQVAELVDRVRGARVLGVVANDVPASSRRGRYAYPQYETAG
jgi:tyrosine-protein kinase